MTVSLATEPNACAMAFKERHSSHRAKRSGKRTDLKKKV